MKLEIPPTIYLGYYPKKSSRGTIQGVLLDFIRTSTNREDLTKNDIDAAYQTYTATKTDEEIAGDLITYPRKLQELGRSPVTIKTRVSIVDRFFEDVCSFKLAGNQKRLRALGLQKARPVSEEITVTTAIIRQLLTYSDNRMKALILVLISSGMRIGEALNMRTADIDFESEPVRISLHGEHTKNGLSRVVFISDEAAEALKVWLGIREDTLALSYARHPELRQSVDPTLVFPYGRTNETVRLIRVTQRAGCYSPDAKTNHNGIHFHSFRKYFLTQFKLAGGNTTIAECLAGHSGYLDLSYRRIPEEELAGEYLRVMPRLTVNVPEDYYECKIRQADEIARLQINSTQQQATINRLLQELEALKGGIKDGHPGIVLATGGISPKDNIEID